MDPAPSRTVSGTAEKLGERAVDWVNARVWSNLLSTRPDLVHVLCIHCPSVIGERSAHGWIEFDGNHGMKGLPEVVTGRTSSDVLGCERVLLWAYQLVTQGGNGLIELHLVHARAALTGTM